MTAAAVETEWSRDYVAFMQCAAGSEWIPIAAAQVSAWLREKGFDTNLAEDQDLAAGNARLTTRGLTDGQVRDFRIRLVEDGGKTGSWTTDLIAHDGSGEDDWIHLSVTNSSGRFVAVPRIANYLAEVLPLRDGRIEFTADPQLYRVDDVDALVDLLGDEERHALVFVAGSNADDEISFDSFRSGVAKWTREVAGLAQVIVLDPNATATFAERVGERFQAPAWTIRTYQPAVDFGDPSTASRHRMMGTERLARHSIRRNQYLLGEIARNQAGERVFPRVVQKARRRFERTEVRRLATIADPELPLGVQYQAAPELPLEVEDRSTQPSRFEKPAPAPKLDRNIPGRGKEQLAELHLVKRFLKLEEITEAGLREISARLARFVTQQRTIERLEERLEEFQVRIEELEDRDRTSLELLEDQQLETAVANLDVDDRDARIRWLESRLKDQGDFETQWATVPEAYVEKRPESFDELLDRVEKCPGLEFTGDTSEVTKLNAIDTNNAALRVAWDAVQTSRDYVAARSNGEFDGSLDAFIKGTPEGYREFPPGKWAHTETGITMQGWGNERVFPVPDRLGLGGQVEMKAHFKLARIGRKTPRMHVYDCHPIEPLICIGYIGAHLTNTHTN